MLHLSVLSEQHFRPWKGVVAAIDVVVDLVVVNVIVVAEATEKEASAVPVVDMISEAMVVVVIAEEEL